MNKNDDLKYIKKHYGENFAHLCRELFSNVLEKPGELIKIITEYFSPNRELYHDIISNGLKSKFEVFVRSKLPNVKSEAVVTTVKTPFELMDEAGYTLYECKTNKEVQSFKKYWSKGEELCTFRDPDRITNKHIFFAVKKDVKDIKRKDFRNIERRQDRYGTSVISLQFNKTEPNFLSIKNRYNHSVENPDCTFSNNLENIIAGLTKSFEKYYGFVLQSHSCDFDIPHYVCDRNGKFYKYNLEIKSTRNDGIVYYFCPDNIMLDNYGSEVHFDKSRYDLVDQFLIDRVEKRIIYASQYMFSDTFVSAVKDVEKVDIHNNEKNGRDFYFVMPKGTAVVSVDERNRIVEYKNELLQIADCGLLPRNKTLTKLDLPNLTSIRGHFLTDNNALTSLSLPNLKTMSGIFLKENKVLTHLDLPNLKELYGHFLCNNNVLTSLDLPSLEMMGDCCEFLNKNNVLTNINLPKFRVMGIGCKFLYDNNSLTELHMPNLAKMGDCCRFLYRNNVLTTLDMPKLNWLGDGCNFLNNNNSLTQLSFPKLENVGDYSKFLYNNQVLTKIYAPKLYVRYLNKNFLYSNSKREEIIANLEEQKLSHADVEENSILK